VCPSHSPSHRLFTVGDMVSEDFHVDQHRLTGAIS
jgi:hypothetical protein